MLDTQKDSLVSIILSCYNSEKYLQQTIDSVLAQTYKNWELIAIDDCSTDNTLGILQAAAALDTRIKVITHTINAGRPSITKNTGLRHAQGNYIQFIDHDDIYLPEKTKALLDALISRPDCITAFSNMNYINKNGEEQESYLPNFLEDADKYIEASESEYDFYILNDNFFIFQSIRYAALHTITCMIAKDRLANFEINFNHQFTITDDTDLWIRLGMQGKLIYLDKILALYRLHSSNLTTNKLVVYKDVAHLISLNKKRLKHRLPPLELRSLKIREAKAYSTLGYHYRSLGKTWSALRAYCKALAINPYLDLKLCIAAVKFWLPVRM